MEYSLFIFAFLCMFLCPNLLVSSFFAIQEEAGFLSFYAAYIWKWIFMFSLICTNYLRICLCVCLYMLEYFMRQPFCCCLCNDLCIQHTKPHKSEAYRVSVPFSTLVQDQIILGWERLTVCIR